MKAYEPYFWLISNDLDEFMGVVYLYGISAFKIQKNENRISNAENLYSAYISICFKRKFWGDDVRKVAKDFISKVFATYNLKKLKAECFSSNPCAKRLLKDLNFKIEGNFKNDTLVNGLNVDLTTFSLEKSDKNF